MIYASIKSGRSAATLEYHVGDVVEEPFKEAYCNVLTADGHELEFIRKNFSGIKMYSGGVITWYDSDANFIWRHIHQ